MSEEKPEYMIGPGQPRLGERRPQTIYFKFAILEEHHQYLQDAATAAGISMAEYLRRLIEADMRKEE